MNNLARQTLRRIVAKHGKEIAGNAERCRALLNDLCGAHRREINILVTAIEERVPLDLLAARSMPTGLLLVRLEKRLAEQTGLTAEAARWAVESWALALGAATDSEIADRALKQSDLSIPKTGAAQAERDENKTPDQALPEDAASAGKQSPPPAQKTRTPPKQSFPKQAPPVNQAPPASRQPARKPFPGSPPAHLPTVNQPPSSAGTHYPPHQPAASGSGGSRMFRGCLIFVFLLVVSFVVLLFGVPFALETMRETQRERQNEPPRFPSR